ncbi:hypothetical protein D3C80_1950590 [compost metagenome]
MPGNGIAIHTFGFLAKPFDVSCAVKDFTLRLGQRLAHFHGQDRRKIIGIGDHQIIKLSQNRRALLARFFRPEFLRLVRCINGPRCITTAHVRQ